MKDTKKKRATAWHRSPRVLLTPGSWHETIYKKLKSEGAQVRVMKLSEPLERHYRWATHILIPGGSDIHPAYYDEAITHSRPVEPERDEVEYQLAAWALDAGKPLMGICRGHQMITVVAGGKLHQDIAAETDALHMRYIHLVCTNGSRLGGIGGWLVVNSYHHQAVKRLPEDWKVAASSTDGVIESIEHPTLPVISVQWHPEVLDDIHSHNLFVKFLKLK